jgi:hypothetical protein
MHTDEADAIEISEPSETRLCPECGTPSAGDYCPHCGEQMETHLFSVKHYLKEVFHEFAVFDTKFFRTIPALLFKPGFLSREYIAGRRKRYLSPARLYILVAFFSFFVLGYYLNLEITKLYHESVATHGKFEFNAGNVKGEQAYQLTETYLKLMAEVSPYVLLLGSTPLFALILKLLYWKRRILYAEHLVFSFHFYAFSLIILIVSLLFQTSYGFIIAGAIFLVYVYFALRLFYADQGFRLLARVIACTFAYFYIASFAIGVSMLIATVLGHQLGEIPEGFSLFNFSF